MVKNKFNFLKQNLDLLYAFILFILSEIICRYFLNLDLFVAQAFVKDFFDFLAIVAFVSLLPDKGRRIALISFVTIITLYNFSQSYHYAFFSTVFSFRKLTVAGELFNVFQEVFEKWDNRFLFFLIPLILAFKMPRRESNYSFKKQICVCFIMVILLSLSTSKFEKYLWDDYADNSDWRKDFYLFVVMQNKTRYYDRFGTLSYIVKDSELSLRNAKAELSDDDKEELNSFIKEYSKTYPSSMDGIYEGKNLVMILCESFDIKAIDPILTPTLYKLSNEAFYFTNYHSPIYEVATGDAEFISQTGMLPSVDYGTTSYTFYLNRFPNALASLFENKGYISNSYHSYISNFYNREALHESFGFETFYDMDKLNLQRWPGYSDTYNWQKDEDLFKGVLEHTDFSKPFYDFVISVSGHMPYKRDRSELSEMLAIIDADSRYDKYDDEAKCYLAAQMLLDRGIETLINGLEAKGVLDNTVIMLYGDHYPYGIKGEEAINNIIGTDINYEMIKVPMMIYNSQTKGYKIDKLTSTFDLYPTVAALFNIDVSKYYTVGNNVFSDATPYVVFADHSVLTEYYYGDATKDEVISFDNKDHNDEYQEMCAKINKIFTDGQKILLTDYYGK